MRSRVVIPATAAAAVLLAGAAFWIWHERVEPVRLLFQGRTDAGYRIEALDRDGSRPLSIGVAGSVGSPRSSPDGSMLAFIGDDGGGSQDLFVARADGREPRALAPAPGVPESAPSWSPDGGRLAFASRREGSWDIFTVGVGGDGLHRLTDHGADDASPSWSRGGIAFQSNRDEGVDHVFVMGEDGSDVHRITSGEEEAVPDWSRDGSRIAYVGFTAGNADIWTAAADGSGARRLTTSDSFEFLPRWSPDGARIAFEAVAQQISELFVIRSDGSGRRRVAAGYAAAPDWVPLRPAGG